MNVKWQTYGEFEGWQWEGVVPASVLVGESWAHKALRVVTAAEGGMVDMVQCYDAGIMTAGPLGATARFGTLQALLGEIPRPVLQTHLGKMFEEAGVGLHVAPGMQAVFTRGLRPVIEPAELREVFFAGSDGKRWNGEQMDFAERWVRGLAATMADAAGAIARASIRTLEAYLAPARKMILPDDLQHAPTRKAAACWVAFAINNPAGAKRLLAATTRRPPYLTADDLLQEAQKGAAAGYPATFAQRVTRTRRALDAERW